MSTFVFPTLSGITWPVKRTPTFKTTTVQAVSGKEVRIALQSAPRYLYEIPVEVLRKNANTQEFQTLLSFYNNRLGAFDSFLYNDLDDNQVSAQVLGTGDGVTTVFQLFRGVGDNLGNPKWNDIIFAPNVVSAVYLNGSAQTSNLYTISRWGALIPGTINFINPPASNQIVSADFTYYWASRFMDDTMEFQKFMQGFYSVDSIKFLTLK